MNSSSLEFCHPLAGETLYFTVTTVIIEKEKKAGFFIIDKSNIGNLLAVYLLLFICS